MSLTINLGYLPQNWQSPSWAGINNKSSFVLMLQAVLWKSWLVRLASDWLALGSDLRTNFGPLCGIRLLVFQQCSDRILNCLIALIHYIRHKNNYVHAFSALIRHYASLVKPDSTILMPKAGLRWRELLVILAPYVVESVLVWISRGAREVQNNSQFWKQNNKLQMQMQI